MSVLNICFNEPPFGFLNEKNTSYFIYQAAVIRIFCSVSSDLLINHPSSSIHVISYLCNLTVLII